MKRNFDLYLEDILEATDLIESYIEGVDFKTFKNTPMMSDAVLRQLTIIGEASNHLPEDIKNKIDVPWEKIVATRNLLIHGYFDIDLKITWDTVSTNLKELKKEIKKYLRSKE